MVGELTQSDIRIGMLVAKHFCGGSQVGVVTRVSKTRCQIEPVTDSADGVIIFNRGGGSTGLIALTREDVTSDAYWLGLINSDKLKRAGWSVPS